MRPRQTLARLGHAEVAVLRVGAQAVGFKVLFAVMADGDALSWPGPLDGSRRAALGLEFLSRRGFGGGLGRVLGRVLAGDFFCAAARLAALDFGFCLAIDVLPFTVAGKR